MNSSLKVWPIGKLTLPKSIGTVYKLDFSNASDVIYSECPSIAVGTDYHDAASALGAASSEVAVVKCIAEGDGNEALIGYSEAPPTMMDSSANAVASVKLREEMLFDAPVQGHSLSRNDNSKTMRGKDCAIIAPKPKASGNYSVWIFCASNTSFIQSSFSLLFSN